MKSSSDKAAEPIAAASAELASDPFFVLGQAAMRRAAKSAAAENRRWGLSPDGMRPLRRQPRAER